MSSANRHYGELPWGWWLRADGDGLDDEDGRSWRSVREAFWIGELGYPGRWLADEQLELMLRTLVSIEARWDRSKEHVHDLFAGEALSWQFYICWLASLDLLSIDAGAGRMSTAIPSSAPLSPKGRSVLLMLKATRSPEWESLPMPEIIERVREHGGDHTREEALEDFERSVGIRKHKFRREEVAGTPAVTLTGIATDARMPTLRVFWSQTFADRGSRDRFYAWLAQRVNRWDDWGTVAHRSGADALTRHFLRLLIATASDERIMEA